MKRALLVAPLVPAVLDGCSTGRCPGSTTESLEAGEIEFFAGESELELDGDGELTEEGCAALCYREVGLDLDDSSCTVEWLDPRFETAEPVARVTCEYTYWWTDTPKCTGGRGHAAVRPRLAIAPLASVVLAGCVPCCHRDTVEEHVIDDVSLSADEYAAAAGDDGELDDAECAALCLEYGLPSWGSRSNQRCAVVTGEPGETATTGDTATDDRVDVACVYDLTQTALCTGRFHAATPTRVSRAAQRGLWLAAAAHDEAASVKSFLALADELRRHGAPEALISRAREAALDEVRHARAMAALAREHGAVPLAPRFRPVPERDLLALALENAVEGCARETFAAFVAHHQARRASARFRPVFARIAADETRHAQWSWDLDAWLASALCPRERRQVAAARRAALRELGPLGPRPRGLGLPSPAVARRMARRFAAAAG